MSLTSHFQLAFSQQWWHYLCYINNSCLILENEEVHILDLD